MINTLQMWVFVYFVKAGGLYIGAVRSPRPYETAAAAALSLLPCFLRSWIRLWT